MSSTDLGFGGYTSLDTPTYGGHTDHGGDSHDTGHTPSWGQDQVATPTYGEAATSYSADEVDDRDDAEDSEDEAREASGSGAKRTGGKKRSNDRSLIRRVAAKTVELADANERQRGVLASLVGGKSDDIVALTTAVMTAERSALAPLNSLVQVLDTDGELDQAITVMGLASEGKLKDVWAVLVATGSVTGSLPTNDTKATKHVVEQLRVLDRDQLRADIAAVNELAKRW